MQGRCKVCLHPLTLFTVGILRLSSLFSSLDNSFLQNPNNIKPLVKNNQVYIAHQVIWAQNGKPTQNHTSPVQSIRIVGYLARNPILQPKSKPWFKGLIETTTRREWLDIPHVGMVLDFISSNIPIIIFNIKHGFELIFNDFKAFELILIWWMFGEL